MMKHSLRNRPVARVKTRSAHWIELAIASLVLLIVAASVLAADPNDEKWLLPVAIDEETMEKRIASYIRKFHDINAEFEFVEEDDLYLKYTFEAERGEFPAIPVYVDTEASNSTKVDGQEQPTERRVAIKAYFVLPDAAKTDDARAQLLEFINEWHETRWVPQRIYLDEDADIAMESSINVPGDNYAVHAEIVIDQMYRMYNAWAEIYTGVNNLQIWNNAQPHVVPTKTTAQVISN